MHERRGKKYTLPLRVEHSHPPNTVTFIDHSSPPNVHLTDLPNEIIDAIVDYLELPTLYNLAQVSSWAYHAAIPKLWKRVELVDKRTRYNGRYGGQEEVWGKEWGWCDEHDDKPLIKKLTVLASNPFIASKVHTLTHRCHLPCPGIFSELKEITCKSRTLSADDRTRFLLQKAIDNMTNVQSLRIIFGHWHITMGLLFGFLFSERPSKIKRLWLENVSLEGFDNRVFALRPPSLVSVRIRRLNLHNFAAEPKYSYTLTRGGPTRPVVDGRAGILTTTAVQVPLEEEQRVMDADLPCPMEVAPIYDQRIYAALPETQDFLKQEGFVGDITQMYRPKTYGKLEPVGMTHALLGLQQQTLTSINFDWILWPDSGQQGQNTQEMLSELSKFRFPHLKAFQFRNAVTDGTRLPNGVYLLEPDPSLKYDFLSFMEYHSTLQCLAWPMSRFFRPRMQSPDITERARQVVADLSRTLVDLRVDEDYSQNYEPMSDQLFDDARSERCRSRRRFVGEFARHLTRVTSLKMEGGIPRDEKRETMRALQNCSLEKLVFIGVSCPIANTWGANGNLLAEVDEGQHSVRGLEAESMTVAEESTKLDPRRHDSPLSPQLAQIVEPVYGWSEDSMPMIWQMAQYHHSTIRELKFCGYNGSPILYSPTKETAQFLDALRYFDNLEHLVLSMWLLTWNEHTYADDSIIKFWSDICGDSSSTALALPDDQQDPWTEKLHSYYAPERLADQVAKQLGPFLSEEAKSRRGGVNVRVSFCLGAVTADIFDLDVHVGTNNEVLTYRRPLTEQEDQRRNEKLDARRWF